MRVDLVDVANDWSAFAVRSVLECYGITVALHPIATAADLVRVLGGDTPISEHLILECHGAEEGGSTCPSWRPASRRHSPTRPS